MSRRKKNRGGPCIPDAEGYQYGVRFLDGSIRHGWNGRTQHDRAQEYIYLHAKLFNGERLTLVRREVESFVGPTVRVWHIAPWEHVDIDPWRKPLTNAIRLGTAAPRGVHGWAWRGLPAATHQARRAARLLRQYESGARP